MTHALLLQWRRVLGVILESPPPQKGVHSSCSHSCVISNCNAQISGILTEFHSHSSFGGIYPSNPTNQLPHPRIGYQRR